VEGRDHDDLHVLVVFPEFLENREPVDVGQPDVEDDQVGLDLDEFIETVGPRHGGVTLVPLLREIEIERFADGAVIIDDEYLCHSGLFPRVYPRFVLTSPAT
jgi:hypothetical protein